MSEEGGSPLAWLADAYSKQDIIDEWDWLELSEDKLEERWYAARWTTKEERENPDTLYDLFGGDWEDYDTTVYYWRVKPDWKPKNQHSQGPFLYWEIA